VTMELFDGQRAIVVVGIMKGAVIVAADGEHIAREISETGPSPFDHFTDTVPEEPGAYLWKGEFVAEDGKGSGPWGEHGDADIWFVGAFERLDPAIVAIVFGNLPNPWPMLDV
jgi:hypothetical protein